MWPTTYKEQRVYVRELQQDLLNLEKRLTPISYYTNDEPSVADLQTRWQFETGLEELPEGLRMFWYQPSSNSVPEIFFNLESGVQSKLGYRHTTPVVELIETIELTSAANIVFSDIPQGYTHLWLVGNIKSERTTATVNIVRIRLNDDSTDTNYHGTVAHYFATGSPTVSNGNTANHNPHIATSHVNFSTQYISSPFWMILPFYSLNNRWKHYISFAGIGDESSRGVVSDAASIWQNTSAVTDVSIQTSTGDLLSIGSRLSLYGVR